MSSFYLDKQVAKIGDTINISGSCVDLTTDFSSDNTSVANINGQSVVATGIGTAEISETTFNCDNTGSIQITVTEDGKAFFMSREEFLQYNIFEVVFVFFFLFVAFLIRFAKRV